MLVSVAIVQTGSPLHGHFLSVAAPGPVATSRCWIWNRQLWAARRPGWLRQHPADRVATEGWGRPCLAQLRALSCLGVEAGSGQPRMAGGVMSPAALSPVPHRPCPRPTAPCSPKDPEKDPCPVCDPHAALMPPGVWGSWAERPSALTAPADPSPPSPLGQLCSAHIWLLFPPLASPALPAA